jgi:aryl carrier-like protein
MLSADDEAVAMAEPIRAAFVARVPAGRVLTDDTNFFEAGFTSVLLAEVLADLARAGIPVDLVDMFRYPTVTALEYAVAVRQASASAEPGAAASVERRLPWRTAR